MNDFPRNLKITTVWLLIGVVLFLVFQALENRQHRSQFRRHKDRVAAQATATITGAAR